jgi:hypothetical protein
LEDGDQLFTFDINGYLENNRTNYDYVLKYDPTKSKTKNWTDILPKQYHNYEDLFTKKDFDKLPEQRPWDHAINLTPGFKPVNCKTYNLLPQEQRSLLMKIFALVKYALHHPQWLHHFALSKRKTDRYALLKITES